MGIILFILLVSYGVTIAIFLFGLELVEIYRVEAFGLMIALSNLLAQLVIYCAFSENLTTNLFSTGDFFYESPWYRLPTRFQKNYIPPIQRAQCEFRLTGLGIIECSLGVFASVRFRAFAFFPLDIIYRRLIFFSYRLFGLLHRIFF